MEIRVAFIRWSSQTPINFLWFIYLIVDFKILEDRIKSIPFDFKCNTAPPLPINCRFYGDFPLNSIHCIKFFNFLLIFQIHFSKRINQTNDNQISIERNPTHFNINNNNDFPISQRNSWFLSNWKCVGVAPFLIDRNIKSQTKSFR